MKIFYLSLTATLMLGAATSQTTMQRISLIEQVTSASCGPCAAQNPAFKTFVDNNYADAVKVTYQRGGGSYIDPMWDFNPNETDSRITSFYGVTHFPNVWINGNDYVAPNSVTQQVLDDENDIPATFHIEATSQLINGNSEIQVDVTTTALQEYKAGVDNQTKVYIAVIENDVNYASAPGLNGETDFYWVMRKMLPDQTGTVIGQQDIGEMNTVSETWAIDLLEVDPMDLDVVVWVQNGINGTVYQATRTSLATVVNPLTVEQPEALVNVNIYPTIVNDQLFASFDLTDPSQVQVNIINATGKVVHKLNNAQLNAGHNNLRVDANQFSAGIYFMQFATGQQVVTKKFMVTR